MDVVGVSEMVPYVVPEVVHQSQEGHEFLQCLWCLECDRAGYPRLCHLQALAVHVVTYERVTRSMPITNFFALSITPFSLQIWKMSRAFQGKKALSSCPWKSKSMYTSRVRYSGPLRMRTLIDFWKKFAEGSSSMGTRFHS